MNLDVVVTFNSDKFLKNILMIFLFEHYYGSMDFHIFNVHQSITVIILLFNIFFNIQIASE